MSKNNKKNTSNKILKKYELKYNESLKLRHKFENTLRICVKNTNNFIQHPKFKEYFFNKLIHPVLSLHDLTNIKKYRKNVLPVLLDSFQKENIVENLQSLWKDESKLYNTYSALRKKYKLCRKYYFDNYKILKGSANHPLGAGKSSDAEEITLNCLHELIKKFQMFYFHSHKFYFCRNHIFFLLEFDFYCIMIYNDRLIQFVIEIDGIQHKTNGFCKNKNHDFNSQNVRDIMKQYYLSQLNIHLLRISDFQNISEQINVFIVSIITTTKYIIANPISIQENFFC